MRTSNQTARFLGSLRAVRRFSDRPIADDVLRDILEVGRRTGSSKNTQPWEIVVVRDAVTLTRLSELGGFAGYVATAQADIVLVMDSANNAFDCGRLAERLMLAAWAHGVGSCIASLFPDDNARRAKELLGIPAARWVRQTVALGYPADEKATRVAAVPRMTGVVPIGRKPLSEIVSWERYGKRS
ncbi:MAG: nitroreductase [Chloroflexi bacterium]|nr:MAG: nitroreductase [Chloroflexota bacterium]